MWLLALAMMIDTFLFLKFFIPLASAGRTSAAILVGIVAATVFVLLFVLLVKEWKKIIGR
jgi:hypothetical protein